MPIYFLAILDNTLKYHGDKKYLSIIEALIKRHTNRFKENKRIRLSEKEYDIQIARKDALMYFNVTSPAYASTTPLLSAMISGYQLQGASILSSLFQTYNGDQLSVIVQQVDDIKMVMQENVKKAIVRAETLDDMEKVASELADVSTDFDRGATNLNRQWCRSHYKMMMIIVGVIMFIGVIVVVMNLQTK